MYNVSPESEVPGRWSSGRYTVEVVNVYKVADPLNWYRFSMVDGTSLAPDHWGVHIMV